MKIKHNISVILKFIVCERNSDTVNAIDVHDVNVTHVTPLIENQEMNDSSNGGKNAISACSYLIL